MKGWARYRRAFDWRLGGTDREANATAADALTRLFSSEMPELLEDYLIISRKRQHNRLALARLQAHLIDELASGEATIKHYHDERKKLQQVEKEANDSQRQQVAKDLKFVKGEIFLWRACANVMRSIADGVAWRALNFDRAALRALCQNRGSQQIIAAGIAEELREWSRQFDHGTGIAILNSLTNWLTYGDITVVHNDGSVEVIEVKSSKARSSRVVRQKQRMRELVTFLNAGSGLLEGRTVQVQTLDITPENGLNILGHLLQQTSNRPGYAFTRLSNSVYLEAIDFRVVERDAEARLADERNSLTSDWRERNDDVHVGQSLNFLSFSPNLAPFSVFPFEPSICVDLLTGAKAYVVFLNVTAVAREFENRGWEIVTTPKEAFEAGKMQEQEDFMTVKKQGFTATVPPAAFMRMHMELLRPQVLVRQCELIRRAGHGVFDSEYNLPIYEHEATIWR